MTSIANALNLFAGAIPRIIGSLLIFLIGYLIAKAVAGIVTALLRRARFDELGERSGFNRFVRDLGVSTDAAGVVGAIVYWIVLLIALVAAFDNLGLPAVSAFLNSVLFWLPNLLVAIVILAIAGVIANAVYRAIYATATDSGASNPHFLASLARGAIWVFAFIVALDQIGVATTVVNTLLFGFVLALALAIGLAFGLGGRDTAGAIIRNWYMTAGPAASRLAQSAPRAEAEIRREVNPEEPRRPGPDEPRRVA
jgi:hypothetical protein